MEILIIFVIVILCIGTAFLFLGFVFSALEHPFSILFHRPFYVHFYLPLRRLSEAQSSILRREFRFYSTLSPRKQKFFEHRVYRFINKYEFIGKDGMVIDDRVKVLIAATSTMLTFGMRVYLYEVITKILVYPQEYLSPHANAYHKGEFNPAAKLIVFSWEDFLKGFESGDDNINLGIHEFAHVLHFHSAKRNDSSAEIFHRMFNRITLEIHRPANREKLISSTYFRIYAYTNQFEFLAVIIEHFFESPALFKAEFPQLFTNVSRMLNHRPKIKPVLHAG